MVRLGGIQIKGNDLEIRGAPAKCIDELHYLILWHCVHQSIRKKILLLADTPAVLDLTAVGNHKVT